MRVSRAFVVSVPVLALALAVSGCGGGSGGGGDAVGSQVLGHVVSRDGSSAELDGVVVSCEETGEVAVTDADGRFEMDVPSGTDFELSFEDPVQDAEPGEDCDESDDPETDASDIDGNVVKGDALED